MAPSLVITSESRTRTPSTKTENELQVISREISWYEEESRKTVRLALQYKLEVGKRLLRAKGLLPHGQFLRWAHHEFGWTPRHVQYHLLLASNEKRVSLLPKAASLRMALAAIKELSSAEAGVQTPVEANATRNAVVEVLPPPRQVHIIGEVVEGTLDCKRLLREMAHIAAEFGAPRTRWKIRE
jgi:hypothetical protein